MNNLSIHRRNNIYKIYSKLNNSYRRYQIERDGQKCTEKQETQRISIPQIYHEPTIENKPCSQPIVAIYKKMWYLEKWDNYYRRAKCSQCSKIEVINSVSKIEEMHLQDIENKKKIELDKKRMQEWMEKQRIQYEKKKEEEKIRRKEKKEELARLQEQKRILKDIEFKDQKEQEKEYNKKYKDFQEKLQAIKEQRWIGKTSSGSKYWFLGVESVDIKDLTKEYADVILYQKRKKNRESYQNRKEMYDAAMRRKKYLEECELTNMSSRDLMQFFENLLKK